MVHRPKETVRRAVYRLMRSSGYLDRKRRMAVSRGRGWATVLVFHSVDPRAAEDGLNISPRRFASICRLLQQHYDVLSLDGLVHGIEEGRPFTGREVVITFDDGYHNNYEHAVPILSDLRLPATFYLTAGYIDTDRRFWWDSQKGIDLPMMTWAHAREIAELGFDIGCHTWSHPDLGTLSPEHAPLEIHQAKAELEDRTGASVRHFAYPYGGVDNITAKWVDAIRSAGFASLVSATNAAVHSDTDRFMIPRLGAAPQRSLEALRIDIDHAW